MGRRERRRYPLLRAAAELANAANAVQPLGRDGYVTIPVFFLGWPTGEAAPVVAGASMLDALRRGLRGDFTTRRGRVALALTVLSWGVLGFVYQRNAKSQHNFEDPLKAALGENYEAVAEGERRRRRGGVLRTSMARRRYVKKADVVRYGPHRANVADIWHRADLPIDGRAPVLLQVPGGAWAIGMRRPQAYPLMSLMAERGWVCVSMAYRVSPRNTWPAHIVDVKRALAWVKENIADYGGDPDFVAISGGSAGGHLTALAALTPNEPEWQPGFESADTSVVAAVPIYGRYDWFSREGSGRPEFIGILQRFIVKQALPHEPAGVPRRVADQPRCGRTRHRSSCCTAWMTRSFRCRRDASSSRRLRRSRTTPSCTPRFRTRSTPSTSSAHRTGTTPPPRSPTSWTG